MSSPPKLPRSESTHAIRESNEVPPYKQFRGYLRSPSRIPVPKSDTKITREEGCKRRLLVTQPTLSKTRGSSFPSGQNRPAWRTGTAPAIWKFPELPKVPKQTSPQVGRSVGSLRISTCPPLCLEEVDKGMGDYRRPNSQMDTKFKGFGCIYLDI